MEGSLNVSNNLNSVNSNVSNNYKGGEGVNSNNVSNNFNKINSVNSNNSISNDGVHCTNTPEESKFNSNTIGEIGKESPGKMCDMSKGHCPPHIGPGEVEENNVNNCIYSSNYGVHCTNTPEEQTSKSKFSLVMGYKWGTIFKC